MLLEVNALSILDLIGISSSTHNDRKMLRENETCNESDFRAFTVVGRTKGSRLCVN